MIKEDIKLPKIYQHDLSLSIEGSGSSNIKEYCKCENCNILRIRRDSIYKNSIYYRFIRWIKSLHF